jgi:DNA-directed RNA polymerase specialized sigma24 family protein
LGESVLLGRLCHSGRLALNAGLASSNSNALRKRFDALLTRLAVQGDAPLSYEKLRRRLVLYFEVHAPVEAEAACDDVIDRLARRIEEGIPIDNVALYALGIARNVLYELHARQARDRAAAVEIAIDAETPIDDPDDGEEKLAALHACLERLGEAGARLILAYYDGEGSERIRVRRALAERMQLGINALRNRALRLRETLESCLRLRLGTPPERDGTANRTTNN